jgi:hypothetical protein
MCISWNNVCSQDNEHIHHSQNFSCDHCELIYPPCPTSNQITTNLLSVPLHKLVFSKIFYKWNIHYILYIFYSA